VLRSVTPFVTMLRPLTLLKLVSQSPKLVNPTCFLPFDRRGHTHITLSKMPSNRRRFLPRCFCGREIVPELLRQRRNHASRRINELLAELRSAESLCRDKACAYITGSVARGEATSHSDLDVFIVSKGTREEPLLKRLDEILVKADLIQATEKLGFPPFSG